MFLKNFLIFFFKNFIFGRFIFSIIGENISSSFVEENNDSTIKPAYTTENKTNKAIIGNDTFSLPPFLQGPALSLDNDQMQLSLYVLDQSLSYIKNYFKGTHFFVIYIPSVLSSYTITSQFVGESKSGNRTFLTEEMNPLLQRGKHGNHPTILAVSNMRCKSLNFSFAHE